MFCKKCGCIYIGIFNKICPNCGAIYTKTKTKDGKVYIKIEDGEDVADLDDELDDIEDLEDDLNDKVEALEDAMDKYYDVDDD